MYHLCYNGVRIKLEELNGSDRHIDEVIKAVEKRIPENQRRSLEYCVVHSFVDKSPEICYDNRRKENGRGTLPEIFNSLVSKV